MIDSMHMLSARLPSGEKPHCSRIDFAMSPLHGAYSIYSGWLVCIWSSRYSMNAIKSVGLFEGSGNSSQDIYAYYNEGQLY